MIYLSETKFVEDFDGLVGWLSYFGYWYATQGYRVKNLDIVLKIFGGGFRSRFKRNFIST